MAGLFGPPDYLRCCCGGEQTCCGPNRCLPNQDCLSPLPSSLRINVSGAYASSGEMFPGGPCDCLLLDSTLTFYANGLDNPHTGVGNVWATTFTLCGVSYRYSLSCIEGAGGWSLSFIPGDGDGANGGTCFTALTTVRKVSCSPLVLSGQFQTSGVGCCGPFHLVGIATLDVIIWEE
jgi:hypothetical protein